MPVSPALQGPLCEMSVNEKTVRGCIGSSGNVRVYVWIRYRSLVMEYGKPVFPGEWMIYTKALQLPYVKLLCDESHGYPNRGFGFFFFIRAFDQAYFNDLKKRNSNLSSQEILCVGKLESGFLFEEFFSVPRSFKHGVN